MHRPRPNKGSEGLEPHIDNLNFFEWLLHSPSLLTFDKSAKFIDIDKSAGTSDKI